MKLKTLYSEHFEHDNCGFGLIASIYNNSSFWLLDKSLTSLERLSHRGAVAYDGLSGDGCGILMQKPDGFCQREAKKNAISLNKNYAVGNVFFSQNEALAKEALAAITEELANQGLELVWAREVPIDAKYLGEQAKASCPQIKQLYVNASDKLSNADVERKLFMARKLAHLRVERCPDFYICSLALQTLSYKGLILPKNMHRFFPDLENSDMATSMAVFHQRFSTNTLPRWRLAQPFRYLAHNGEINTIQGNRISCNARIHKNQSKYLPDINKILPIVSSDDSDSCSLDNMLEMMVMGGMSLFKALKILIPPAWQNIEKMDADLRAFYEFYSVHMEPWDGPAALVLTDGRYVACSLDRNGLRPARWVRTTDDHITLASEIGVYNYQPQDVVSKGRLTPGEMLAVDTQEHKILLPNDINTILKKEHPYKQWLKKHRQRVKSKLVDNRIVEMPFSQETLHCYQKMFNLNFDEAEVVLKSLAINRTEAIASMGDDTPLAVLSNQERALYEYFRQQFAQVTNPPIDSLRENIVMSLEINFSKRQNIFSDSEILAKRLIVNSPILSEPKFREILNNQDVDLKHHTIDLNYPMDIGLKAAIMDVIKQAVDAIDEGATIIVLSDKGICEGKVPVHALLATGALHHHLINLEIRSDASILIETATARDPHHFAVLLAYGATAIFPYLAYQKISDMCQTKVITDIDPIKVARNYRKGLNKGLFKILSKMGISTLASYRSAQLFEIIGLADEVVELCFFGTHSRIGGISFETLHHEQIRLANNCWNNSEVIPKGGFYKYTKGGEYHAYNPDVIHALQAAVVTDNYATYKLYSEQVNGRPITCLRDLMSLNFPAQGIDPDQVEPISDITKRFSTAAMSLGAISPEAHETLAVAMNTINGRSNSGEGSEDEVRFNSLKNSKIKQIASGRFGVTPHYLVNAEELQIKIAQGAKPGEGGQLPGHKVNKMIARLRFSTVGVALISPPPHHDIYSIEDLAQLIYDLKQVNPTARVSVKLVSQAGVGTIAVGVAKAGADLITIAGYDGGTGASPLTSIKYGGSPWELGIAETHLCLQQNNLRGTVALEADGGLKTGLDVVKAAILGAELFGFGTAPLVALGCTYLRVCHLNNCSTAIATQDETLREKFYRGNAEKAIQLFTHIAAEVRELMAKLGVKQLTDLIGRVDLLKLIDGDSVKHKQLDLTAIINSAKGVAEKPRFCMQTYNEPINVSPLSVQLYNQLSDIINRQTGGIFKYDITNVDRSIGANLSGLIAKLYGKRGIVDAPIHLYLTGSAGQSLGVWNSPGLNLTLVGDANDYVGKGMAGGTIIIHPPYDANFISHETTIIGNTCLYGATGGTLYAAGQAGERFAVRNSGATAVVEGVGDHGCEYMTGGVIIVLGKTGINFGAGMTGGIGFVLDLEDHFVDLYNHELIDIHRIQTEMMEANQNYLFNVLTDYTAKTRSRWGEKITTDFSDFLPYFWLVKPVSMDLDSIMEKLLEPA